MADFSGSVQGRFVDDDDIVRTGRAMIELDGYDFMQVPIPTGLKQAWDDLRGESSSNLAEIRSKAAQAAESAGAASKSATAAKTSETNAASSKNAAASSAAAAGKSESNAASSASAAKTSESNAATSKSAAASSASSARQDADRAVKARTGIEEIAATTSWSGDRLTVNGKTSPSLRGPKGDRGDTGQPGPKGDSGASTWADISGKPSTFPPSGHRHSSADISDASNDAGDPKFGGKVIKGRERDGKIFYYSSPTEGKELANKGYVDTVVAEEKARTVGMVWMVETENQAKAKETSCQKGDFIQVADTGNIYKVV